MESCNANDFQKRSTIQRAILPLICQQPILVLTQHLIENLVEKYPGFFFMVAKGIVEMPMAIIQLFRKENSK